MMSYQPRTTLPAAKMTWEFPRKTRKTSHLIEIPSSEAERARKRQPPRSECADRSKHFLLLLGPGFSWRLGEGVYLGRGFDAFLAAPCSFSVDYWKIGFSALGAFQEAPLTCEMKEAICRCCGGSIIEPSPDNPNVCLDCGNIGASTGAGDDAPPFLPHSTFSEQPPHGDRERPNAGNGNPLGDPD
jgi:hypothetical protein